MARSYYDDNFGHYDDMDDPDNVEFYRETQRTNVRKKCQGCKRMVSIQPRYAYCNSCADKRERGDDLYCDDGDDQGENDGEE